MPPSISPAHSRPPPSVSRRRETRYLLILDVTLDGENNFYTGVSGDVEDGGLFIATCQVIPIGTSVVMTFTLPDGPEALTASGVVEWVRDPRALADEANVFGGNVPGVKPGVGVRFVDLAPSARARIAGFTRMRRPELFE